MIYNGKTDGITVNNIQEKYRILTEKAFELICELDSNGIFTSVSSRYMDLLGYSGEDLIGKPFLHTVHPEDQKKVYRTFLKSLSNPSQSYTVEYRGLAKWGQWRWMECTGFPLELEKDVYGGLLVSRDLKERKQTEIIRYIFTQFYAEASQIESFSELSRVMDQQFRPLEDSIHFSIFLKEEDKNAYRVLFNNDPGENYVSGDVISLNETCEDYIYRNNQELFIQKQDYEKVASELKVKKLPRCLQFLGVPINQKETTIGVLVLRGQEGGEIYDERDLRFIHAYAFHISLITEGLRSEIAKRRTENMLQLVLDNVPQYVFWKDKESRFLGCNKNMLKTAGFSSVDELVGKSDYDLPWTKKETEDFRRDDREVIETGVPKYHIIEPQTQKDGSIRWHDTSKMPLKNEQGEIIGVLGTYEDITQRKLQEEEIKANELKYHTLFESSNDAIFIMRESEFIDCNRKTLEIYGCKRDEIIGKHPSEFSPEYQEDGRLSMEKASEKINTVLNGQNQVFEWKHIKLDGTPFDAEVSLGLMVINEEKFILAVVRDITERKENLHELNVQKAYLEELFDGSPEATVILDNDDNVLRINRQFTNLFGYTEEELLGEKLTDSIIPLEKANEGQEINERVVEGQIIIEDTIRRSKEGREIDVSIIGNRVVLEGEQIALLGVYSDISQRVKAVKQLQKSEKNLATILDSIRDAVIATDSEANIIRVNPGAELLLNMVTDDLIDERVCDKFQILDSMLNEPMECPINTAISENKVVEINDCVLAGPTIKEPIRISAKSAPIREEDGSIVGCVLVMKDISEELRLRQQLYESQKMEAVGQLAGGIAHDFNNLLAIIKGHSNIAMMAIEEENPAREKFELILRTVERSSRLIKQLLTFSRKEHIDPQLIDLNVIVNELRTMLNRLIVEKVELVFEQDEELGLVNADPGHMEQIIVNLSINARDAMPNGGVLKISTRNVELEENNPLLISHDLKAGKFVLLQFEDEGIGIKPENFEKIFEPFYTTKSQGQGTGLGLSTVYGIVQQNNGVIDVESELDKGTIFNIYLPRST